MVYLITGQPGTGKTTAAHRLYEAITSLKSVDMGCIMLDGDNMRKCWPALKYTPTDRLENIQNILNIAKYLHDNGNNVIVSVVAPLRIMRHDFREAFGTDYFEIHMKNTHTLRPDNYYTEYEPSEAVPEYTDETFQELLDGFIED